MDRRQAKRYATRHLGQVAQATAKMIEERYRQGGTFDQLSRADAVRVVVALYGLASELNRRGGSSSARVRAKAPTPIDPDQATLDFEE